MPEGCGTESEVREVLLRCPQLAATLRGLTQALYTSPEVLLSSLGKSERSADMVQSPHRSKQTSWLCCIMQETHRCVRRQQPGHLMASGRTAHGALFFWVGRLSSFPIFSEDLPLSRRISAGGCAAVVIAEAGSLSAQNLRQREGALKRHDTNPDSWRACVVAEDKVSRRSFPSLSRAVMSFSFSL